MSDKNTEKIICGKCGKTNSSGSAFCGYCGEKLENKEKGAAQNAANAKSVVVPEIVEEPVEEPKDAFAQGLPDWNVEPPALFVRRRH